MKEVPEQTAAFTCYKYGYFLYGLQKRSKKTYPVVTCVVSSLVSRGNSRLKLSLASGCCP